MMRLFWIVFSLWLVAGPVPAWAQEEEAVETKKDPAVVVAAKRDFERTEVREGTFIPAEFEAMAFWPEEYQGDLLVLEVLAHGTPVNDGDLIARFDVKGLEKQIKNLEREVESARRNLENTAARNAIQNEAAAAAREEAEIELELARRGLEGWEEHELAFQRRSAELQLQGTRHYIEDQQDELAQLNAMYSDDELVDATEEIVLKRSRRDLARLNTTYELQQHQDRYAVDYNIPAQRERRHLQLRAREGGFDRLLKNQEIEERERDERIRKAEMALRDLEQKLERLHDDRQWFELRAGCNGVLLHGKQDDYRPGRAAPRHERGSRLPLRSTLFMIADPDRMHLALDVPESKLDTLKLGMGATVSPLHAGKTVAVGTLRLERFPAPQSAAGPENHYRAAIEIGEKLPGLVPGMRGKAEFKLETMKQVFVVPGNAVFLGEKEACCWAADPGSGEYRRVALELGPEGTGEMVVYGDLTEGMQLLLQAPEK